MNRKRMLIAVSFVTALIVILLILLQPNTRYKRISIDESKWNSIINSRTENNRLMLEDIRFNDYGLVIDRISNTIYYSVVNDSKNKYNPAISYTSNNDNTSIAILSDEITDERIKSDYTYKLMIYDDKSYHIYNLKLTDLPIIDISYKEEAENKQKNIPVEVFVFNNLINTPKRITISNGRLRINENSYTFSLNMTTPGNNIRPNELSILNMKPNSEYILTQTSSEEDNNKQPANRRVLLFINSQCKGIYDLGYVHKEKRDRYEQ